MQVEQGLVLLSKPSGITSFKTLKTVKNKLGSGRVGHTGTLDRFASGLLAVLTGKLTRLADLFSGLDKTYHASVILGATTDTLDPEGKRTECNFVPPLGEIEKAVGTLTGTIDQIPPKYSAIHIEGRRAYQIARSGGDPQIKPREVVVYSIEIEAFDPPCLELTIDCSSGTYVRALARDLGILTASCAYVQKLQRSRIGPFKLMEAVTPESFDPDHHLIQAPVFLPRLDIELVHLKSDAEMKVRNGAPLQDTFFEETPQLDGLYSVLTGGGKLAALAERKKSCYSYRAVLLKP